MNLFTTPTNTRLENADMDFIRKNFHDLPITFYYSQLDKPDNPGSCRITWMSHFGLTMLGYTYEEMMDPQTNLYSDIIHPEDADMFFASMDQARKAPTASLVSLSCRKKPKHSNEYLWFIGMGLMVENPGGKAPAKMLVMGQLVSPQLYSDSMMLSIIKTMQQVLNKNRLNMLSMREREVLAFIAQGKTDREIAQQLIISINTARKHRSNLKAKTGFKNSASLVAFASDCGI